MSRGLERERRVARALEDDGYLVGSRRHIGGAGDLLAAKLYPESGLLALLLIEVKSTIGPYDHFGPKDRRAMIRAADKVQADPLLYWWPKGGRLRIIGREDWPK